MRRREKTKKKTKSKTSSLERMLAILDSFTEQDPVWSMDELATAGGYTRSTAYRYVKELSDSGFLTPAGNARYSLGPRIIQLDRQLRVSDPMLASMRMVEPDLPRLHGDQAWLLCRLFKDTVICIHRAGSFRSKLSFSRGFPMPLFSGATSKVVLAFLSDHQHMRLYLNNQRLIAESGLGETWEEFRASVRQIRKHGYAGSVAEVDPGVFGIAAPIFSPEGRLVGSISNVRPVAQLDKARWAKEGRQLTAIAARISAGMSAILGKTVHIE